MKKLIKILAVVVVVFGVLALNTTNAKAFSIRGFNLTRTTNQVNGGHDIFDNVAITNISHRHAKMFCVVVKEKGKKAVKENYFINPGETVEVFKTSKSGDVCSIYRHKVPRKFTVTVSRLSNKQTHRAILHSKHAWAGMRWTQKKMSGGIE